MSVQRDLTTQKYQDFSLSTEKIAVATILQDFILQSQLFDRYVRSVGMGDVKPVINRLFDF